MCNILTFNERFELKFILHCHVRQVKIEALRHNLLTNGIHVYLPVFFGCVLAEVVDEVLIGLEHRVNLDVNGRAARHKAVEVVVLK